MNKTQIVAAFAEKAGITKTDASKFFNALMGVMADNIVEGDGEISIPDFGRFSIKHVAERQGVNPATGEKITRLVLAANVAKILKNGMALLGIEVPERM